MPARRTDPRVHNDLVNTTKMMIYNEFGTGGFTAP